MDQSTSLISAQVQFMDTRLVLVHIPLDIYPFFLQPLLQLIFLDVPPIKDSNEQEEIPETQDSTVSPQGPAFLNLSITPVECSVVCSRELADLYFAPLAAKYNQNASPGASSVSISKDDYVVMQVEGQGLDAGQRVLELTSPLAMAGISIFFISTYFSDYILVPLKSRSHVMRALEARGFTFEESSDAFVNTTQPQYQNYTGSPTSMTAQTSPPLTPPPSTLSELQTRTFTSLRRHHIVPYVDKTLRLVQCAAHHRDSDYSSSLSILRPSLTTALIQDKPRFLSLTIPATDPAASILLEPRLLPRFSASQAGLYPGNHSVYDGDDESLLLGSKDDILVPITLDLRDLPLEATGIVCGVAGRLAAATHSRGDIPGTPVSGRNLISPSTTPPSASGSDPDYDDAVEISFLSTARAGTVVVGERELERAMAALDAESREPETDLSDLVNAVSLADKPEA